MGLRILIVEDEPSVSENLAAFLEDEGMTVAVCNSGEAALEAIDAGQTFDIAVVDVRLPGIDGLTAIKEMHRRAPDLQYLVHTGSTSANLRRDAEQAGVDRRLIFYKPLDNMEALAEAIRDVAATTRRKDSDA